MPRLPRSLLRRACSIDGRLVPLLRCIRDLQSAENELHWLREHVMQRLAIDGPSTTPSASRCDTSRRLSQRTAQQHLSRLVTRRSRGTPIHYLLGTAFFGELEIACCKDVLIPRWETAEAVKYLVHRLTHTSQGDDAESQDHSDSGLHTSPVEKNSLASVKVLDLCTGTGCIPLLFGHEMWKQSKGQVTTRATGVDISGPAINLARSNARQLSIAGLQTNFLRADVLQANVHFSVHESDHSPHEDSRSIGLSITSTSAASCQTDPEYDEHGCQAQPLASKFDILISNPPYISAQSFRQTTHRSVRRYEPLLALVPPHEDCMTFYRRLIDSAADHDADVILLEVADLQQAMQVVQALLDHRSPTPDTFAVWQQCEIWRDEPDSIPEQDETSQVSVAGEWVKVRGRGHGRSVVAWRDKGYGARLSPNLNKFAASLTAGSL